MLPLLALLGLGAAIAAGRRRAVRHFERDVAARLPLGSDGLVAGAAPLVLDGPRVASPDAPGVLVLHGFGDTTQTVRALAERLHAEGYAVRAPLLPGHGRSLRDFSASDADAWIAHARAELALLRAQGRALAIVGLSMGGALGAILAAEAPDVRALVLLAPYVSMPTTVRRVARVHGVAGLLAPYLRGRGERSIQDPAAAARNLAYGVVSPALLRELLEVVERTQAALPKLRAPTLVLQSREDIRIPVDAAEREFAKIGSADRTLEWLTGTGHVITVDYGHERVFARVVDFLARHLPVAQARDAALQHPA
jgi:carboxylesterase